MSEWIKCSEQLPPIREILSEKCVLQGEEIPTLYRSGFVLTFDGRRVSGQVIEWFHASKPLSGITHWMPLPEPPQD